MKDFSALSWAPASAITIGCLIVGTILIYWGYTSLEKWRRQNRRNRRLMEHGNQYSMRDLK